MDEMVSKKVLPNLARYSFELSIDGYSTKGDPRHNVIVMSNGIAFALASVPTAGESADANHMGSIMKSAIHKVASMETKHQIVEDFTSKPSEKTLADLNELCFKITWITLDGAYVNHAAVKKIVTDLDCITLSSKCSLHSLNLLLKDFLKVDWVEELIAPTKLLLRTFKNNSQISQGLKDLGGYKLKSYPVTRIAYFLITLKRILENRKYMIQVVQLQLFENKIRNTRNLPKRSQFLESKSLVMDNELFWHNCEVFVAICSPILALIRMADKCSSGFVSFIHFGMGVVRGLIKRIHRSVNQQISVEELDARIEVMDTLYLKRLDYVFNDSLLIARLLNPALRKYNSNFVNDPELMRPLKEFFKKFGTFSKTLSDEFDLFSIEDVFEEESFVKPPHQWWYSNGVDEYPTLSLVARRVTQASSSASITEQYWSALDFQLTDRRMSLTESNLELIMNVYFNTTLLSREPSLTSMKDLNSILEASMSQVFLETDRWADSRIGIEATFDQEDLQSIYRNEVVEVNLEDEEDEEDIIVLSSRLSSSQTRRLEEDTSGVERLIPLSKRPNNNE
ncbi:hypothetical protein GEMRC1_001242 [Eukaryota sp. GEM-RC1]